MDLQALRESLDKIQKRVDLADAKSLENQKIIENLKKTIAEDEKAMATVKQSLTGKEKEITDLEKKLAECHDNQVGLQGTIQNLQKENRDLQGKVKALSASLAEDSAKCEELKKKNAQAEEKLAQLENKNNQLSEEVSTLIQKNKDMASQHEKTAAMDKETIQKLQLENNKLNRTIDSVGLQHENLQKQNAKMRSLLLKLIRDRKEQKEKIANRYKELEDTFEKELEDGNIQFHKTSDRIVINLQDKISFKSGSSKLRSQIKPSLDKIVNIITKYPGYRVYIEGHTDDIPLKRKSGFKDNWELSTERALSVLRYMLANHDLEADRFSASGYGQYHPLFPNTSTENRRKNRRVDIVLMYTGKKAMGEEKEDESTQGPSLEVSPGSKEDSDPDFEIGK
ncbi:MAG: OmpA family protein [Spirochaetota bacterium]